MTETDLRAALVAEGIPSNVIEAADGFAWGNGPGERYAAHRHDYDKVLLGLAGSITFELVEPGSSIALGPGDRLDLPRGTLHAAAVGPAGVRCFELHLPAGTLHPSLLPEPPDPVRER